MERNFDISFLRPKKAEALCRLYEKPLERKDNLQVWRGAGTILPSLDYRNRSMGNKGGVVDEQGKFVSLSAINAECRAYPVDGIGGAMDQRVVYCGYFPMHWGHFLTEVVCRLWYALDHDDEVEKYIFTVRPGFETKMHGNMRSFFDALGILEKVELTSKPAAYREIIVPELCYKTCEYDSNPYLRMFDKVKENLLAAAASEKTEKYEKIFLSRSRFLKKSGKTEAGTELLDDFFSRNGYQIIYPEEYSLAGLTRLLHEAKECATTEGTISHNILFAPESLSVVIVEREAWLNTYQIGLNRLRPWRITHVDAHYSLYPTEMGFGPYLIAFTKEFQQFATDRGFEPPSPEFVGEDYLRRCFQTYMNAYFEQHGYQWKMSGITNDADYLYESYESGCEVFGPYLRREKPFKTSQYFQPHYWRKMLGRMRRGES